MKCPNCGDEINSKFKFCVKCGTNIENPSEINIEQKDFGGYRTEEDYQNQESEFKIGSGTFTINDKAPQTSSLFFSSEELNESYDENDSEPYIPKLDAERIKVPEQTETPPVQQNTGNVPVYGGVNPNMYGMYPPNMMMPQGISPQPMNPNIPPQNAMPQGISPQPMNPNIPPQNAMPQGISPQPMNPNIPPQNAMPQSISPQPMNPNIPPQNAMQQGISPQQMNPNIPPQNAIPNPYMQNMYGYGQPMMAPQFMGYDMNGMPIYTQMPVMAPQFMGYDMNGMPIYAAVPIYPQQMINNEQMSMYPNAVQNPYSGMINGNPMQNQPVQPQYAPEQQNNISNQPVQNNSEPPKNAESEKVTVSEEFWNGFFENSEKNTDTAENTQQEETQQESKKENSDDDFFNKPERRKNMSKVSAEGLDSSKLERNDVKKKKKYMSTVPTVNADELVPNNNEKNKKYMQTTKIVNADELEENVLQKSKVKMGKTLAANADELEAYVKKSPEVVMSRTEIANAEDLEEYKPEHVEAIMAKADKAVEALPKKKEAYVDELDKIELPEHMKAKKKKEVQLVIPEL